MASNDSQSSDPQTSSNRPSLSDALQNPQSAVLIILSGLGLIMFGVLLGEAVEGLKSATQPGDRVFIIWPTILGIGLWGWMMIERSFVNADPTLEIIIRRAGVLGLGIVLCRDMDPGIILAAMAGYAICGVRTRFLLTLAALTALVLFPTLQTWLESGWLNKIGVRDFAGDTLHILAGMIGVVILTGTRWANHQALPQEEMRKDRAFSAIIGLLLIQIAFAAVLGRQAYRVSYELAMVVVANGTAAAIAGGIVAFLFHLRLPLRPRIHMILFGNIAGWVVISGGANNYSVTQSLIFGGLAAASMVMILFILDTLELRDPFALVPIHLACGTLGLLLVPAGAGSDANLVMQLVAVFAIAVPAFAIGCLVVLPFVKTKLLSKFDPTLLRSKRQAKEEESTSP